MSVLLSQLAENLEKKHTLYITRLSGRLFFRGKRLVSVHDGHEDVFELAELRRVVLVGRPPVESAVLYRLIREGIPMDWLDVFGRPMGMVLSLAAKTPLLTASRQEAFRETTSALELARQIVLAKIDNCREVLRRRSCIPELWRKTRQGVRLASSAAVLRGMEGQTARLYFGQFGELVQPFSWSGRHAHPAPDPVNMLLSFGYGMLHNRFVSSLHAQGIDTRRGFFHASRGSHCALASDLMEDMRYAVDRVVLRLIRKKQLRLVQFRERGGRCHFVGKEAFPLVLESFEEMFQQPRMMYPEAGEPGTPTSLNNAIDTQVEKFKSTLLSGTPYSPFRSIPWNAIL